MLHHDRIFYVDRVQADRVLTVEIVVGTSLPAYAVATGRVLLADRTDAELDAYLASVDTRSYTAATTIDTDELREKILAARNEGWSLADEELTEGVRSIAVPFATPKATQSPLSTSPPSPRGYHSITCGDRSSPLCALRPSRSARSSQRCEALSGDRGRRRDSALRAA